MNIRTESIPSEIEIVLASPDFTKPAHCVGRPHTE